MLEEIVEKPRIEMQKAFSLGGAEFKSATVVDIQWERINLFMNVSVEFSDLLPTDTELEFFAVNRYGTVGARFNVVEKSGNNYRLFLNITNAGDCSPIPAGDYSIYVCSGTKYFGKCSTSINHSDGLIEASRTFLYRNRSYGFIVKFLVNDGDDALTMHVMAGASIGAGAAFEYSSSSFENLLM